MSTLNSISQKEYLKKYLSGDIKKKKKKKVTGVNVKRSVVVDDDIDLESMRPLEDDEVDLYQMDEDAPQIAGIVDERPPELKAQEYYSSKRWKVFGGEDGVNVVDSMNKDEQNKSDLAPKTLKNLNNTASLSEEGNKFPKQSNLDKKYSRSTRFNEIPKETKTVSRIRDLSPAHKDKNYKKTSFNNKKDLRDSDEYPQIKKSKLPPYEDDSDVSLPRKCNNSNSDSDASPPRRKSSKKLKQSQNDSDESPPRKESWKKSSEHSRKYREKERGKNRNRNNSNSPPRGYKTQKHQYNSDSNTPPRREKYFDKRGESDSDASPPRKNAKYHDRDNTGGRSRKESFSSSDNTPPRRDRRKSSKPGTEKRRSLSPSEKHSFYKSKKFYQDKPSRQSRRDINDRIDKKCASDSNNSPPRRRSKGSDSDLSPPRKDFVNDRPLKKTLYKPNDSSSDEGPNSRSKKMKTTLDGKQAGLQDARQLKKELSDLKMKEDSMFSKMEASVSGVGAAPVKRDRKTGKIRDLEEEKEAQKQKEAKESVVNEKYYKWGKGIKQTEDAAVRAAEAMKEMNKPLARYVDDKDLDEFLKAQEREGDPMLEYIKKKQSESTPLQGEKPIYKGSCNPNRFNIRPGYRWDGVVRSNGYEQEWFKTKNAKKARDEEAYKWSTSDM